MKRKKLGKLGLKMETVRRLSAEMLSGVAGGTGGCETAYCNGCETADCGGGGLTPCCGGAGGGYSRLCTGVDDPCCTTYGTKYC